MGLTALAVDGGNSKTEALLVAADGTVLGRARGAGFRPQIDGVDAAMKVLTDIVADLHHDEPVDLVSAYLAGADLPAEEDELRARIAHAAWGRRTVVGNDTMALLRTGAPDGWGVAVVCGAGINAIGVSPDGHVARFPAVGDLTGDWGGGYGLARSALWSAVRGEDGRGPVTALSSAIATRLNRPTALAVGLAVHTGDLTPEALHALSPLLFEIAAAGDAVATALVERLAEEVALMAEVLVDRLALRSEPVPLVLGGGVLTARHPQLDAAMARQFEQRALTFLPRVPDHAPVVGAALLALDEFGAGDRAEQALLAATAG